MLNDADGPTTALLSWPPQRPQGGLRPLVGSRREWRWAGPPVQLASTLHAVAGHTL